MIDERAQVVQDFKAYAVSFEGSQLELPIVFANRLLSNLIFHKDRSPAVVGYALRVIAHENIRIEQISPEAKDAADSKKKAKDALREAIGALEGEIAVSPCDPAKSWLVLHKLLGSLRGISLTEPELNAYTVNPDYTGRAIRYLFREFLLNEGEMSLPGTVVPLGCQNELNRLISVSGIHERDLPFAAIVVALSWLHEYATRRADFDRGNEALAKRYKDKYAALLKPIEELLDEGKWDTLEKLAPKANAVLIEVLTEWRRDFIRFMDVPQPGQKRGAVQISRQTRDKISESVKGALERDLLGKKARK